MDISVASNGLISLESISMTNNELDRKCQEIYKYEHHSEQANNYRYAIENTNTKAIPEIDGALLNNTNDMKIGINNIVKNFESKRSKKSFKCSIKKENNTLPKNQPSGTLKSNRALKKPRKTTGLKISSQLNNLKTFTDSPTFLENFNGFPMNGSSSSNIGVSNKVTTTKKQHVDCAGVTEDELRDMSMSSSKNAQHKFNLTNLLYQSY